MSINNVTISGNLGKDPEVTYTKNGKTMTKFSLAVNESKKGSDGKYENITHWIPVVVFGWYAENVAKHLKKGSGAVVTGRITTRSWETQSGEKRYVTEVTADTVVATMKVDGIGADEEVDEDLPF